MPPFKRADHRRRYPFPVRYGHYHALRGGQLQWPDHHLRRRIDLRRRREPQHRGVSGTGTLLVAASTILTSDGVNMPNGALVINGTQIIRSNADNAGIPNTSPTTARPGTSKVASLTSVGVAGGFGHQ